MNTVTKPNTALSPVQRFQADLALQVERGLTEVGQTFTDYGKQCVINAIAAIIMYTKSQSIELKDIDQTSLKIALTNVGLTELNFNAIPAEAFPDIRKGSGGKYIVAIRPQGAGNEKLVRNFGVNVDDLKPCIFVREGDEYTLPGFDGEKMTPFKWTPKSLDKKVIMVVYPLKKTDGTMEYLMATRDSIVPNLIAQIRNANLYTFKTKDRNGRVVADVAKREEFYEKLNDAFEGKTLDEILAMPEWKKELSNTYTSGGSKEAMIIRKMQNNALKRYPRDFNNAVVAAAVKDMFEDKDESLSEKHASKVVVDANPVETVESEISEEPIAENAPRDFNVDENGEVDRVDEVDEVATEVKDTPEKTEPENKYESEI